VLTNCGLAERSVDWLDALNADWWRVQSGAQNLVGSLDSQVGGPRLVSDRNQPRSKANQSFSLLALLREWSQALFSVVAEKVGLSERSVRNRLIKATILVFGQLSRRPRGTLLPKVVMTLTPILPLLLAHRSTRLLSR
jgi:hypothetical protein